VIRLIRDYAIPAALSTLPPAMTSREAAAVDAIYERSNGASISGAAGRYQRPTAPHHVIAVGGGHVMAVQQSIRPDRRSSNGTPLFRNECACGHVSFVDRRRIGRKCHACAMADRATHRLSRHPIYRVWTGMKSRCYNPRATGYQDYGGRGSGVCDEWVTSVTAFAEWAISHGWKRGLEIDRIDGDGHYEPTNCRIATHRENSQHTRRTITADKASVIKRLLTTGMSVREIADVTGVSRMVVWHIKRKNAWNNVQ
jgi:hypothetical protein